jgi:cytochrome bd-type quinol oxidase subunit 2
MALILLIIGAIALSVKETRSLGVIGVLYAAILPGFGMMQMGLLIGPLHWLIQLLHLLIGVGSIAVVHLIGARYLRLKKASRSISAKSMIVSQPTPVTASDEA